MTQGHLIFAQNSNIDYVKQAYALALTIKKHNKINSVCLVTNDDVPKKYAKVFDHIIDIPWGDSASKSTWKIENRWKLIYASPYDETMVYDSDMLLTNSNDKLWKYFEEKDLVLTSKVLDYKGNIIQDTILRKCFVENKLPNVYFGFHYFKKTTRAYEFYKWLEIITKNWQEFYAKFTPKSTQKFCSMDVNAALALMFMGTEDEMTSNVCPTFTHMKPQIQGWTQSSSSWRTQVGVSYTTDNKLKVGNFLQTGVFHYTEDDFLTNNIINTMRY